MRELISEHVFGVILTIIAIAGPICGAIVGAVVGAREKAIGRSALAGFAWGCLGLLLLALWHLSGALINQLGISTTRNLLAQIGLFVVVGIATGVIYTIICTKPRQT
jgi:hypothetical protein